MISLDKCTTKLADPFPVSVFDEVFTQDVFDDLTASFPAELSDERRHGGRGRYHKDCLADRHHTEAFQEVLSSRPVWRDVYNHIKGTFPEQCAKALGWAGFELPARRSVAIEFSSLPANGGGLLPHPDSAKKVATCVYFMEPCWEDEWGGAFEVLRHNDPKAVVDLAHWEDVTTVEAVHVRPRRAVFMQRTPISYHGVRAMKAPYPRRSITVNLIAR